jgi:glutaredoxin
MTAPSGQGSTVEVLWRPGCAYCIRLRGDLRRRGVPATWRNIWQDPEARSTVARLNQGNETVPTVRVGDTWLTNPTGARVADLAAAAGVPVPVGSRRAAHVTAYGSWVLVAGLVIAGEVTAFAGRGPVGLGLLAAAGGVWWLTRPLRR